MAEHSSCSSNNNASSSAAAATAASITIDGSNEDSALSRSEFPTRQEVLKRWSRRLKRLIKISRDHYWHLMEELKFKYIEYYWTYGKSPFQEEEDNREGFNCRNPGATAEDNLNNNSKLGLGVRANGSANWCEVHECKMRWCSPGFVIRIYCRMRTRNCTRVATM